MTAKIGKLAIGAAVLALLAACGQKPDNGPSSSTSDTVAASETTTTTTISESTEQTTSAPAPAAPTHWTMPNLVGKNLQAAQDKIQSITGNPLFVTTSHDATGAGRHQVLDRNWKVCSQNVAPGKTFSEETQIDFGAVKNDESCP